MTKITLRKRTLDGCNWTKHYKTIAGAHKTLVYWVGPNPTIGTNYAVCDYGVVKIIVEGATVADVVAGVKTEVMKPGDSGVDLTAHPRTIETQAMELCDRRFEMLLAETDAFWTTDDLLRHNVRGLISELGYHRGNDPHGYGECRRGCGCKPELDGRYLVCEVSPVFCQLTDGYMGTSYKPIAGFDTEDEALAYEPTGAFAEAAADEWCEISIATFDTKHPVWRTIRKVDTETAPVVEGTDNNDIDDIPF